MNLRYNEINFLNNYTEPVIKSKWTFDSQSCDVEVSLCFKP